MRFMELIPDVDYKTGLLRKLSPPLVTLLSSEPEVQYVALRNINLIVQKRSEILKHEIKVFFVKYNDPIYVKLEKLDIMIKPYWSPMGATRFLELVRKGYFDGVALNRVVPKFLTQFAEFGTFLLEASGSRKGFYQQSK